MKVWFFCSRYNWCDVITQLWPKNTTIPLVDVIIRDDAIAKNEDTTEDDASSANEIAFSDKISTTILALPAIKSHL
jgi:hypothetical protein